MVKSNKKLIFITIGVVSLIIYLVYFIITPHFAFRYYYSKDKKHVITQVHYYELTDRKKETSYFTYGFYDKEEISNNYFQVLKTYEAMIQWKNDICIIHTNATIHSTANPPSKIFIKEIIPEEWTKMEENATGEYNYIYAG